MLTPQWINFVKYAWNGLMRNEFEALDYNMDARLSVLDAIKLNAPSSISTDAGALIGFWIVFQTLGFISLHFLHRERR